jgi:hypothetical protein
MRTAGSVRDGRWPARTLARGAQLIAPCERAWGEAISEDIARETLRLDDRPALGPGRMS